MGQIKNVNGRTRRPVCAIGEMQLDATTAPVVAEIGEQRTRYAISEGSQGYPTSLQCARDTIAHTTFQQLQSKGLECSRCGKCFERQR